MTTEQRELPSGWKWVKLGDIAQISGVLRDIRESHPDKKIFILTTLPYV